MYSTVNQNEDKGKILDKIPAFEGCVIEKKGSEYKIQYITNIVQILPIKQNSKII